MVVKDNQEDFEDEGVLSEINALHTYHIRNGDLDRRSIEATYNHSIRILNQLGKVDNGDQQTTQEPKKYIALEESFTAYKKVLDDGDSAKEALCYTAKEHGKDTQWADEVGRNYHPYASKTYHYHKNHAVQKEMLKDGTLRPKSLKGNPTPHHQLSELSAQRKLHSKLNKLEQACDTNKDELAKVKDQVGYLEVGHSSLVDANLVLSLRMEELEVKHILGDSLGELSQSTSSEKKKVNASKLKANGWTQLKVARVLDISRSTMKRWWKDL